MTIRPINRNMLASFIEYAANGVVKASEWDRFAVSHYQDKIMENARRECVRIFHASANTGKLLPTEDRDRLYRLARELRDAT